MANFVHLTLEKCDLDKYDLDKCVLDKCDLDKCPNADFSFSAVG